MDQELDNTLHGAVDMLRHESAHAKPPVRIDPLTDLHIRIRPEMAPYLFQELTPDVLVMSKDGDLTWRGVPIVVTKESAPERGCFVARSPNGKGGGMRIAGDTIQLTEHWQTEFVPVDLPGIDQ